MPMSLYRTMATVSIVRNQALALANTLSRAGVFRKRYSGTFEEIAEAKQGYMHADGFKNILKEFPEVFDSVKALCGKLRAILFTLR